MDIPTPQGLKASTTLKGEHVLSRMTATLRVKHYSLRTEEAYLYWTRSYIEFLQRRFRLFSGSEVTSEEKVRTFLEHLALEKRVSSSTQNQALNALVFFYRYVLEKPIGELGSVVRAKQAKRLPVILSREEVAKLLNALQGEMRLMAQILYGCGLRVSECLNLRIKDLDFSRGLLIVRAGKGNKDRRTMLPQAIRVTLEKHIATLHSLHELDLRDKIPVPLPDALEQKYPNAGFEWPWRWVFPAAGICHHPRTGKVVRYRILEDVLQRAIKSHSCPK